MTEMPVTVLVRYRALPGRRDDLQAELKALIELVLQEPGCGGITLHLGISQPDEILLYERWSDEATYWGPHSDTPHLKAFISRAPALLAGMPEITLWRSVT